MNVVILAAGMGKRMQSDLPKVLHPLAGKPLLSHVIDTARTLNPSRVCVVYGHGGDMVPSQLAADDLRFVLQAPQLGTGHAVMQAADALDDAVPTLVLYGDVPLTAAQTLQTLVNTAGKEMAVQDGIPVESAQPAQVWETLGVNSKVQLAELERIYQRNIANALLDQGVTLADPNRIDVRGVLRCGRDVSIDIGCVFEGEVALGDGVSIGANCVIRDAKIDRGVTIKAFSHIDGATIGADAQIGPYARLRPGTELGADVHVGNFVEIKNSQFDTHSKANHLAYVGDATVGARVNIGAGTITCNYDGANKHRTVIEDDAFIGSDTQLVAPVTVGKGATLGAGTTLTKDAPPDSLTVSRAKQISITGWQRPVKTKK